MEKIEYFLMSVIILICLSSCEGYKALLFHNISEGASRITIYPNVECLDQARNPINFDELNSDSTIVFLEPDSTMIIFSEFTTMMGKRLYENELSFSYLKIESQTDTIIASSKQEIMNLIYPISSRIKDRKGVAKIEID